MTETKPKEMQQKTIKCSWCGRLGIEGVEIKKVNDFFEGLTEPGERICSKCWESLN